MRRRREEVRLSVNGRAFERLRFEPGRRGRGGHRERFVLFVVHLLFESEPNLEVAERMGLQRGWVHEQQQQPRAGCRKHKGGGEGGARLFGEDVTHGRVDAICDDEEIVRQRLPLREHHLLRGGKAAKRRSVALFSRMMPELCCRMARVLRAVAPCETGCRARSPRNPTASQPRRGTASQLPHRAPFERQRNEEPVRRALWDLPFLRFSGTASGRAPSDVPAAN